jgi:outer membrane protein OmpA-like peptidoglycan-associated protein
MKFKLIILSRSSLHSFGIACVFWGSNLFLTTYSLPLLAQQNHFNWDDTVFVKGAIRNVRVEYDLDAGGLMPSSRDTLNFVVRFMKQNRAMKIEFDTYTDPRGSDKHNMILSQARSQSCVDYVISQGIDSARLVAKGWGFHKPLPGRSAADIAKMKTQQEKEAAYQADRRMEVKIIAPDSGNIFSWGDERFMKYSRRVLQIHFGLDSANIKTDDDEQKTIDTVINFLKFHSYLKVGIYVHTDPRGNEIPMTLHYVLSYQRALSVCKLLISKGIDSARIVPKGWRGTRPLYSQKYIDDCIQKENKKGLNCLNGSGGWYTPPMNRRVEIVILGTVK